MLQYYKSEKDKYGNTYSIDSIRATFETRQSMLSTIEDYFNNPYRVDITSHLPSNTPYRYKYLFTINYSKDDSMTIGFCFNGNTKEESRKCFIDFNPNKLCHYDLFWQDYTFIRSVSALFELSRMDIAMDIPTHRNNILLRKDKRCYTLKEYSSDNRTEYLGQRNKAGRVKIYNKQIEASLDYPLTRIEVTCENVSQLHTHFPTCYIIGSMQFDFSVQDLNDTDTVLLSLLNEKMLTEPAVASKYLKQLGRGKREKLSPYLLTEDSAIVPDYLTVSKVVSNVFEDLSIT